jgi:hypothetical protein
MGRRPVLITAVSVAGLWVAACQEPLAEPTYAKPTDTEAMTGYKNGLRADMNGRPVSREDLADKGANPVMQQLYLNMHDDDSENQALRHSLQSLEKIKLGACQWQRIDDKNINVKSSMRVKGRVEAAYFCDFDAYHYVPDRGTVKGYGVGYFYKEGDDMMFAGKNASGFEEG